MTDQHVPHTPPLWRKVLSLPHTRLGWWAIGLAAPALVLTAYSLVNQALGGPENQPGLLILAWILSAVAGGVLSFVAVPWGESSLLVWLAQVPFVVLVGVFFAMLHIPVFIAVLLWAVMVFNIWNSTRLGRKRS